MAHSTDDPEIPVFIIPGGVPCIQLKRARAGDQADDPACKDRCKNDEQPQEDAFTFLFIVHGRVPLPSAKI